MVTYFSLVEVPPATLAYFVGRWAAIAQIEANAGSGREHAVELHALVLAAVAVLQRHGQHTLNGVPQALKQMIETSYHEVGLTGPVSDAELLRHLNVGFLL